VDFDARDPAYRYSTFEEREASVRAAADRWAAHGLAIRFGAEITYGQRWEQEIRDHLRRHRYEWVIGSVHDAADSPYRTPERVAAWVNGRGIGEIVGPYFREVTAAARSGLFDVIGHLDVVKRYVYPHVMPTDFAREIELYEPVLQALLDSGTGLEINSSGLRQSPRETYPPAPVVAQFRAMGGERITTGSDTHAQGWFAFGLEEAYGVAAGAGFDQLTFRRLGERVAIELPARFQTREAPGTQAGQRS
jgi:histidinol-phosphatase (PHP family)